MLRGKEQEREETQSWSWSFNAPVEPLELWNVALNLWVVVAENDNPAMMPDGTRKANTGWEKWQGSY